MKTAISTVTPAKAGVQALNIAFKKLFKTWIPAFAGMTLLSISVVFASPHAYPVPYVAKDDTGNLGLNFTELPANGTIKVATITGEEVIKLDIPPSAGIRSWDLRSSSGKPVATGVYFFIVDGDGQKTTGKIVIIR